MAISLALDAFAVATSTAIATPNFRKRYAVKMGLWFGAFQFAMPLAGWLLATSLSQAAGWSGALSTKSARSAPAPTT